MYGLQIFDTEALQVLFRCRDAAVAQDPSEVEEVPTGPKIAHRETCAGTCGSSPEHPLPSADVQ